MSDEPRVSVIVVTYNGRQYLADCLKSLHAQPLAATEAEVIVVDNASIDGTVEDIRQNNPWVKLIALPRNVGFAAGNNAGIAAARGRYIALLNNDAVAQPGWLSAMLTAIEQAPSIGGVASKICFRHDSALINSTGLLLYRDGRGGDRGFRQRDVGQFDKPDDVFGPCGAAALYRSEMLADVGGFDERLFMYYEDLDLAWRARRRGWRFVYEPGAVVHHVHCASAGEDSPFFCFHVERNRVLVNWKNQSLIIALLVIIGLPLRALRAWWRVLRRRRTVALGIAYLLALFSSLWRLPGALNDRYRIRRTTAIRTASHVTPKSQGVALGFPALHLRREKKKKSRKVKPAARRAAARKPRATPWEAEPAKAARE
jgi:GT2 family glycosyltransferase